MLNDEIYVTVVYTFEFTDPPPPLPHHIAHIYHMLVMKSSSTSIGQTYHVCCNSVSGEVQNI